MVMGVCEAATISSCFLSKLSEGMRVREDHVKAFTMKENVFTLQTVEMLKAKTID